MQLDLKDHGFVAGFLQMGAKFMDQIANQNKNLFYKLKLQKKIKLGIFDIRDKIN